MPSGAKKRKAAKKKKEKGTTTTTTTTTNPTTHNLQGDNDLKSQDDKGSDGDSPAYHDHDDGHLHPFDEGNEETEEGDPSAAQPSAADAKSAEIEEAVGQEEGSVVVIEWDLKSDENCEIEDVSVVKTNPAKESDYENGRSSGGSSNVGAVGEKSSKDEEYDSVKEKVTFDELVKSIDSSHAKMTLISEDAPVEEAGNSVKPEGSISRVNTSEDVNVVRTKSAKESDYENGDSISTSNVETVGEKSSKDEAYDSVKETVTFDELVKSIDSSHAKMTTISEDAPVEEVGNSVKPAGCISLATGSDTGNALLESQVGATKFATDTDETVRTSSLEVPKRKEFENIVLPPVSRSPLLESTNGTELVKDSDAPESSENQSLVSSAPRIVQKTSWLNCCGLFEVLSGSNR